MTLDTIPRDPVYNTYITNHNHGSWRASPERSSSPYRPASGLTHTELQLESSRGVYQHFHRPFNDHSRFLTAASPTDIAALRDLPREAPPPWDGSSPGRDIVSSRRPSSAPSGRRRSGSQRPGTAPDVGTRSLLDNMTTQTGVPCYTVSSLVEADLVSGTPVVDPAVDYDAEDWRVARVQTYQVPPSRVGYGEGAVRPFHQDYRHYKYYGFAGHGAKTSWAHNPKYSRIYGDVSTSGGGSSSTPYAAGAPPPEPLQGVVGGPRRSLTAAEKALVGRFRQHNYESEGQPSDPRVAEVLEDVAAGRQPSPGTLADLRRKAERALGTQRKTHGSHERGPHERPRSAVSRSQQAEIIEPFNTKVDLDLRRSLPAETSLYGNARAARVTTYRQMPSPYAGELNRSPNHGSQSPWHQRYGHYKYSGFAGKGASSSWARNPKYAKMYD